MNRDYPKSFSESFALMKELNEHLARTGKFIILELKCGIKHYCNLVTIDESGLLYFVCEWEIGDEQIKSQHGFTIKWEDNSITFPKKSEDFSKEAKEKLGLK